MVPPVENYNPYATKGAVLYYTEGKSGMQSLLTV